MGKAWGDSARNIIFLKNKRKMKFESSCYSRASTACSNLQKHGVSGPPVYLPSWICTWTAGYLGGLPLPLNPHLEKMIGEIKKIVEKDREKVKVAKFSTKVYSNMFFFRGWMELPFGIISIEFRSGWKRDEGLQVQYVGTAEWLSLQWCYSTDLWTWT